LVDQLEDDSNRSNGKQRYVKEVFSSSTIPKDALEPSGMTSSCMFVAMQMYSSRKAMGGAWVVIGGCIGDFTRSQPIQWWETKHAVADTNSVVDSILRAFQVTKPSYIILRSLIEERPMNPPWEEKRRLIENNVIDVLRLTFHSILNDVHFNVTNCSKVRSLHKCSHIIKEVWGLGDGEPITHLHIDRHEEVRESLMDMIEYITKHTPDHVYKIPVPERTTLHNMGSLQMNSNILHHLDMIDNHGLSFGKLMSHMSSCCLTLVGKKRFAANISVPSTDASVIEERLDRVEILMKTHEHVGHVLRNTPHIEHVLRNAIMKKMTATDIIKYHKCLQGIFDLIIDSNGCLSGHSKLFCVDEDEINEALAIVRKHFQPDRYDSSHLMPISTLLVPLEGAPNQEEIEMEGATAYIQNVCRLLNESNNTVDHAAWFKVDQATYEITTTTKRWNTYQLSGKIPCEELGRHNISKLHSVPSGKTHVAIHDDKSILRSKCARILQCGDTIRENLKSRFRWVVDDVMVPLLRKNLIHVCNSIALLDVARASTMIASRYRHTRPLIQQGPGPSHFHAKGLRHPIIEKMATPVGPVANDVFIGSNPDCSNGTLLYGVNASGKSTLMKSIGIALILAQAGMFVPCTELVLKPYNNLFSRMCDGDDIQRGFSTFTAEINDIKSILCMADENTMVIGDELCSGTETVSGISIVCATIDHLIKKNTQFVFATHLHELTNLKIIQEHIRSSMLTVKHMQVHKNKDGVVVYDHILRDGQGDTNYGILICASMRMPEGFIETCNDVSVEINDHDTRGNQHTKTSRYNAHKILGRCEICKVRKAKETHHILEQKHADDGGYHGFNRKNALHNLVGLCSHCHANIHENNTNGCLVYKHTTKGVVLETEPT
jgi:DNA mismatch repair protein MutS